MACTVESNGGIYFIPAFSGMGAPHWKMDARASIVGLTFGSNKNHVVRAALESVAFRIKDVIVAMEKDSGVSLFELKVDGGMTANSFLMQLIADLLAVKAVNIGLEEISALGAAYMAGLEIGEFKSINDLSALRYSHKVFEPSEATGQIQEDYDAWQEMIAKHC
jgi:glycerol kinase